MDERAVEAVKMAINKAKICKKLSWIMIKKRSGLMLSMQMGKESMQSRRKKIFV